MLASRHKHPPWALERGSRGYHWGYSFSSWLTYAFKSCVMRVLSWFKCDECWGCLLHILKTKSEEKKDPTLWRLKHFIENMDILLRDTVKLRHGTWYSVNVIRRKIGIERDHVKFFLPSHSGWSLNSFKLCDRSPSSDLSTSLINTNLQSRELLEIPTMGLVLLVPIVLSSNSKLQLFRKSLNPFSIWVGDPSPYILGEWVLDFS